MGGARDAIMENRFPTYVREFFASYFGGPDDGYPKWTVDALRSVGIDLLEGDQAGHKVVDGNGAKWEYSDRV